MSSGLTHVARPAAGPGPTPQGHLLQQHTKARNDSLVLSAIYDAGQISRAAVSRQTGLSRTSVGEVVAELLGSASAAAEQRAAR